MEEEQELIEKALDGDGAAFQKLIEPSSVHLKNWIKLKLRSSILSNLDAEDILQESYIKAYKQLSKFGRRSSFKSWLWTIAYNRTMDYLRRSTRSPLDDYEDVKIENIDVDFVDRTIIDPLRDIMSGETSKILRLCYERLPQKLKDTVYLRIHNRNFREMSEIIRLPENTIRSRYQKAIKLIRVCCAKHDM